MKKQISGFLLAGTIGALAITPAMSQDGRDKLDRQIEICRSGTQMIVDGASDDEEEMFFRNELANEGWNGEGEFTELLTGCVFYKYGFVDGSKR